MLYRVHEILLIASPYDSYILEEDGRLTEQILGEYIGMNLIMLLDFGMLPQQMMP